MKKLQYKGESKILLSIVERINYLLEGGGGGGILHTDKYVEFQNLTWQTSADGKYYSDLGNPAGNGTTLVGCCIGSTGTTDGWKHLKTSDNVIPFIESNKLYLSSNTTSFSSGAAMTIIVLYT